MSERGDLSIRHPDAIQVSYEGTLEILDEIENGPRETPERRATLDGARKWRSKIERYFLSERKHATERDQK